MIGIIVGVSGCRKNKSSVEGPPVSRPGDNNGGGVPAQIYSQNAVTQAIGSNVGGFYEGLPYGYNSNTDKYPLLVFLHGGGELGNGTTDLPLIKKNAVSRMLDRKTFPKSFTVNGKEYSFVIIQPQFKEWPKPADVRQIINYSLEHYRIDTHRIYLAGLSMGGGATWEYAQEDGDRLAAIVPICGASWANLEKAKNIAKFNLPVWAFHNKDDSAVSVRSTTRYVDAILKQDANAPVKTTIWETGGHDAWTKATDPDYKEDNKNIYEWMLQFTR